MSNLGYELPPEELNSNIPDWCRRIAKTTNGIMLGRTNNTGTISLTLSSTTTIVNLPPGLLSEKSLILFDPLTSQASAELHSGQMYVDITSRDVLNNQFTITHGNSPTDSRNFRYIIVG